MSTKYSRFALAALTAATMALPLAVANVGPARAACGPGTAMTKCGAKWQGKCAGQQAHHKSATHHRRQHAAMGKCAGKCAAKKCAPKCGPN